MDELNAKRRTPGLRFSLRSVDADMSLHALREELDYSDGIHHSSKRDLARGNLGLIWGCVYYKEVLDLGEY